MVPRPTDEPASQDQPFLRGLNSSGPKPVLPASGPVLGRGDLPPGKRGPGAQHGSLRTWIRQEVPGFHRAVPEGLRLGTHRRRG